MIQTWLDNVDLSTLMEMGEKLEAIQLEPGQVLFSQDDPGDSMYLVVEGQLEVLIHDEEAGEWLVDRLEPGEIVGEMALLTGQKRAATVKASEATELHRLSRDVFEELCAKDPDLLRGFGDYVEPRLQRTQLVGALSGLFGPLELEPLHELQNRSTWLHIPAGQNILSLEEPPGQCTWLSTAVLASIPSWPIAANIFREKLAGAIPSANSTC
jgi:hypothetical protein